MPTVLARGHELEVGGWTWTRITGSKMVCAGPCLLAHVVMSPDANRDYSDIYDGRDATSGKLVVRYRSGGVDTIRDNLNPPLLLSAGLYVKGYDDDVETCVHWAAITE
jgi:hypothetical protein